MQAPELLSERLVPPIEGVSRWRQYVFAAASTITALFHTIGIGAAYYSTSWFIGDPTAIESRVHGVAVGAMHLFAFGLAAALLVRRPHRNPAALWLLVVGVVAAQIATMATMTEALPEQARTNAFVNATSVPVPALVALLLYPRQRRLLDRDRVPPGARLLVAAFAIAVAVAAAVPLFADQLAAVGTDRFISDQPRYAETANALLVTAIGAVVIGFGIYGWQVVAALAGVVSASTGAAALLFPSDKASIAIAPAIALTCTGAALMALAWTYRRSAHDTAGDAGAT